jgi:hypothetical protein
MKIKTGKYYSQWGVGISFIHYAKNLWSIILDLGPWYIEISSESDKEEDSGGLFPNTIVCDRCGSPNDVHPKFTKDGTFKYRWECGECTRYDEYMENITNEKQSPNT